MQGVPRRWLSALRIDRRILLSFLMITVLLFVFARIASEVIEGDTMAFDRYLVMALRRAADPAVPIGPRWFNTAMLDLTAFGGVTGLTLLTMIIAGFLVAVRKAATAAFLLAAVASGALVGTLLKLTFARARPDIVVHLVAVHTASFPSGHAMNSAVVYLTLGALLARAHAQHRVRIYVLTVAILLTLTIGFSRVYLGVHWPSDVLAGWIVGAAWAVLCSTIARRLQLRRTIEPATAPPLPVPEISGIRS